jgi:hypothetical protein
LASVLASLGLPADVQTESYVFANGSAVGNKTWAEGVVFSLTVNSEGVPHYAYAYINETGTNNQSLISLFASSNSTSA